MSCTRMRPRTPSSIIDMQNGQLTASVFAPVATASFARSWFTRWSGGSSTKLMPPPPPQQNDLLRLRSISMVAFAILRGASYTPFCRPR
jgi:hypothetical protein